MNFYCAALIIIMTLATVANVAIAEKDYYDEYIED